MSENDDQRALRKWIHAGLQIPEVVDLRGDAAYLLGNMIAKYTLAAGEYAISSGALTRLRADGVDLDARHKRSRFYGKKGPYIYEHAVPTTMIRTALLDSDRSMRSVERVLGWAGEVAVLLRAEDEQLRALKLVKAMPVGWRLGDDPYARYRAAEIGLSKARLRVEGAIVR